MKPIEVDYTDTPALLTQHVFSRQGCPIHYWLGGPPDKPLVMLFHGATMDHRMFNAQIPALIDAYRVLVWDGRGHGQSQPLGDDVSLKIFADDALAIADVLGVEEFSVVGQSLGGYIAQQIYRQAPQRLNAMVIIGSTPLARAYNWLEVIALKASLPLIGLWPYDSFVNTVAETIAYDKDVQRYAIEAIHQIPRKDMLRIWKAVTLMVDGQGDPALRLDLPLLLIHGDEDTTGTIRRDMPIWAGWEKQAEYQVISGARHNANQDKPQETNHLLRSFLDCHLRS